MAPRINSARQQKINGAMAGRQRLWRTAVANGNSEYSEISEEGEYKFRNKEFLERAKRWVIIVDDEESIRLAVGEYLYDVGYQVTACRDADALLEVMSSKTMPGEESSGNSLDPPVPDAIVSDIRMPGNKDGIALLQMLKADGRLGRVPVILLTAKSLTKDRIEGYKSGADAYLPKPFDPRELLAMVDNVIRRRKEMTGSQGQLLDLKEDMSNIKQLLRRNGSNVVKQTDVYLTLAEREVLEFICRGYTNAEIAQTRNVSVVSIQKTVQNLYSKTQTKTRTKLSRWALETGQIDPRQLR